MKVSFATLEDIDATVEMASHMIKETRYKSYEFNGERFGSTLKGIIESERGAHCLLIASNADGNVVGTLIGCVEQHIFSDEPVASVVVLGVLPKYRMGGAGLKLLTAFKKWAENRGAIEMTAGVSSGVDLARMDSFLRKLGFQLTGGNYSMALGTG